MLNGLPEGIWGASLPQQSFAPYVRDAFSGETMSRRIALAVTGSTAILLLSATACATSNGGGATTPMNTLSAEEQRE